MVGVCERTQNLTGKFEATEVVNMEETLASATPQLYPRAD